MLPMPVSSDVDEKKFGGQSHVVPHAFAIRAISRFPSVWHRSADRWARGVLFDAACGDSRRY
jgi:hypothetical protein